MTTPSRPEKRCPYLIVDLSDGPQAIAYPKRFSIDPPDLKDDTCRTTELWLRYIPRGFFTMGSPKDEVGHSYDEKLHKVLLSQPFYIGVFPVTEQQWRLVMGSTLLEGSGEIRPVECVSYTSIRGKNRGSLWPQNYEVDDNSFMGQLRQKTLFLFDLPTEAQWEHACRAGMRTSLNSGKNLTDDLRCPNVSKVGRYYYNQGDGKGNHPDGRVSVGMYRPNSWGLYDMHGNVWEWCLDWYAEYLDEPCAIDPKGASIGTFRILRGGRYNSFAEHCRAAYRNFDTSDGFCGYSDNGIGFRVCALRYMEEEA